MSEPLEELDGVCTWRLDVGYLDPPDYCDEDTAPGEDYCPKHLEMERRMAELEKQMAEEGEG